MICLGGKDSKNGEILLSILNDISSSIVYNESPTYSSFCGKYNDVLDVSLCSLFFLSRCVSHSTLEHNFGSHHYLLEISFEFALMSSSMDLPPSPSFNLDKANWPDFSSDLTNINHPESIFSDPNKFLYFTILNLSCHKKFSSGKHINSKSLTLMKSSLIN